MVFYRKYRPQTIEELDSKEVRDKLTSILSKDSGFHALLFTGPKGLGKTSAARIVAKAVNCEKRLKTTDLRPKKNLLSLISYILHLILSPAINAISAFP